MITCCRGYRLAHRRLQDRVEVIRRTQLGVAGNGADKFRSDAMLNNLYVVGEMSVQIRPQVRRMLPYEPCDLSAIAFSQTAQKQGLVVLVPTVLHQLGDSVVEIGKLC